MGFGLGNTQYEHFNAMGILVDAALAETGAQRLIKVGLGDDDIDLEADFEKWRENELWPTLKKRYLSSNIGFVPKANNTTNELPKCDFVAEYLDNVDGKNTKSNKISEHEINSSTKHYFTASDCPVTNMRELRSKDDS